MNLGQINQRMDLKGLLECIDDPIERMSTDLVNIKDVFECKLLNSTPKPQLISLSVKENENSRLDVPRTIYQTSSTDSQRSVTGYWKMVAFGFSF